MKTENELIGKILSIDQMQIDRAESALTKVLPAVEKIINEYNALKSLPAFNQKVWESLLSDNGEGVCAMYRSQAAKDASQFKNAAFVGSILGNVDEALKPFQAAIKAARKAVSDAAFSQTAGTLYISLQDIRFIRGSLVIDPYRVTEVYTLRIENEAQAELYKAGKQAEKALEKLRSLLEDTDSDPCKIGWGCGPASEGVFTFDVPTARLTFDVTCVPSAKQELPELAE